MKIFLRKLAVSISVSLFLSVNVLAQTSAKYEVDIKHDNSCELNNLRIDMLAIEAKKSNQRIFVISRLNRSEQFKMNRTRLYEALTTLTQIKGIDLKNVVIATGTRTSEKNGRLEFYLGSELFLVSHAGRNKQVCLICCPV